MSLDCPRCNATVNSLRVNIVRNIIRDHRVYDWVNGTSKFKKVRHRRCGYPSKGSYIYPVGKEPGVKTIKVMSKHFTAAVETALFFNSITVARAIELGISEEALQKIENDKVNAACMAS